MYLAINLNPRPFDSNFEVRQGNLLRTTMVDVSRTCAARFRAPETRQGGRNKGDSIPERWCRDCVSDSRTQGEALRPFGSERTDNSPGPWFKPLLHFRASIRCSGASPKRRSCPPWRSLELASSRSARL